MAFDPQAATAKYIDSLGPAALQKAHDYTIGKEWMLLWALLVAGVVTWLIVRSGLLDRLDRRFDQRRLALRAFLVSLVYLVLASLLTLPWTIYSDWWRERGYGRTSQPLGDFLGQGVLSIAVTSLVGAIFFIGVYWLIRRAGRAWWLWSGGLAAVALAFVMLLSPVLIEPLFNKYEPVPPGQVRDAVVSMAQRAGHSGGQGLHVQRFAPVEQFHRQRRRSRKHRAGGDFRRGVEERLAGRSPRGHRSRDRPLRAQAHLVGDPGVLGAGDRVLLARGPAVPALRARLRKQRRHWRSARHSGADVHDLAARLSRAAAAQHLLHGRWKARPTCTR